MLLLIDIGNTRIKWAQLHGSQLGAQQALAHAGLNAGRLQAEVLALLPRPRRVLVANVGGAAIGAALLDAVTERWGLQAEFVNSAAQAGGVRNAYPEPAKLGVDRWLAMIGARASESGPVCVVSVGTAMTIDGVDATGRHLGGIIVPGPDLMVSSLLHNTSEIAARAQQGSTHDGLFADNTLGAIQQGAVHALAAVIERAVETMRIALNERPVLLLTGGASERIAGLLGIVCRCVPDLVLRGLAVLAQSVEP